MALVFSKAIYQIELVKNKKLRVINNFYLNEF